MRLAALTWNRENWLQNDSTFASASINRFYNSCANRFMVCFCLTFLAGLSTWLALEAYGILCQARPSPITFRGVYAWETALNFGLCHFIIDEGSYRLGALWTGFRSRTVKHLWLIWFIAFFFFMVMQRTVIYERTAIYHPVIVQYYDRYPDARPDFFSMMLYCLPFWLLITTLTRQLILSAQSHRNGIFSGKGKIRTSNRSAAKPAVLPGGMNAPAPGPSADLMLNCGGQRIGIDPETITHITVEDHYCRFFLNINEAKKQIMALTPLKAIVKKLPPDKFTQIHRSHVIRLEAVRKLLKKGRTYYVTVGFCDNVVPISRQRQSRVLPVIRALLAKADDGKRQAAIMADRR